MRAIDADALIQEVEGNPFTTDSVKSYIRVSVSKMPTIEPERKKGRWVEQDDSWDGVYYECSVCSEPWTTIDGKPWDNGMNYCPNCGAEMEKTE